MNWDWLSFFIGCFVGVLFMVLWILYTIYKDGEMKWLKWLGV